MCRRRASRRGLGVTCRYAPARGTLGHEVAVFYRKEGLDPEALGHNSGDDGPQARFRAHVESTHEVWHVLTGIGADIEGEIELQAFYFGQLEAVPSLIIASSALLNSVLINRGTGTLRFESLTRGWVYGRRARPLVGVDWSAWWATPLSEVRREFNLDRDGVADAVSTIARTDARAAA